MNLEWGFDASEAVEYGRLHDQLYPLVTDADNVYPTRILDELRERGHNVTGAVLISRLNVFSLCEGVINLTLLFLLVVSDVNRVAAVIQLVVQRDGVIYGM